MSTDEVIEHLCEALEDCECGEFAREYRSLYEKSYGKVINKETADEWVRAMAITDGSDRENGMKWTYEQTLEVGNKLNLDWQKIPKIAWYVTMNMVYSDNYGTAKYAEKHNDPMFFAKLAKDWLCDEDAPAPNEKLYNYYFRVICE